ncbi:MAG: TetR/AcrR family transcriptional regulator [Salibacteraceae bacterium]
MGIAERKERERVELRDKIISAASQLFVQHGFEGTSIRMIAKHIEYSPATIYLHFKDKNELFFAISERAFQEFFKSLSKVQNVEDPMERLQAMGHAYLEFANDNPAYYDLMFVLRAPMEADDQDVWSGRMSHKIQIDTVSKCIEKGHFKGKDPHATAMMIWSCVHGMASLRLCNRLTMYDDKQLETTVNGSLDVLNQILSES